MYNVPGLLAAVVRVVGREGEDHKLERGYGLMLITNIARSSAVRKSLLKFEGLMENVVNVLPLHLHPQTASVPTSPSWQRIKPSKTAPSRKSRRRRRMFSSSSVTPRKPTRTR